MILSSINLKLGDRVLSCLDMEDDMEEWFEGIITEIDIDDAEDFIDITIKRDDGFSGSGYLGDWQVRVNNHNNEYIKKLNIYKEWDKEEN